MYESVMKIQPLYVNYLNFLQKNISKKGEIQNEENF